MKKKFIAFICLSIICAFASADTLDSLLNTYYSSSSGWVTYLKPIAQQMYWFWFACELLYQITFKKILANDVQKLWYFMVVRIFAGYVFFTIFVDPAFYVGIINYFVKLGGAAGGFTVSPTSGNPFGSFSPSSIVQYGSDLWNTNWGFIKNLPDMLSGLTVGLPLILITGGVYILTALMAFTLFMTALEAYIVMNAGVILLGFAGSSWTMGFWNKYLSYVGGIAIRLFVMCLILGLIQRQILLDSIQITTAGSAYLNAFANGTDTLAPIANLMSASIKTLIDLLICTFLVIKVPAMAGSMLTGTVNSGLGDVIAGASMVMAGAGLAAGLGKMGINMGSGGSSSSGGGAKEAFKDSLRGSGGGGLPSGSGSSGSSSDGNRTASQTSKNATAQESKASAMRDQVGLNKPSGSNGNSYPNSGSSSTSSSSNFDSNSSSGSNASNSSGGLASPASPSSNNTGKDSTPPNKSSDSGSASTSNYSGSSGNNPLKPGSSASSGSGNSASATSSSSKGSTPSSTTNKPNSYDSNYSSGNIGSNSSSNSNGGGISGSQPSVDLPRGGDSGSNQNKAQNIKKSINQNSGNFRKNLDKLNQDTHSGAAEINISPHKE